MRGILLAVLVFLMTYNASTQDRSYGRSIVMTDRGIVATSHYLASQAGAQVLAQGGSAMDAAIAANAVLGVTEPMMNGIGGDLFLIYWDAKAGKLYGLNASGWAPRKLTIDFLSKHGITAMPHDGIHSVTVPGAVDGWSQAHKRFGRLPWKDLFTLAIYYAEHGYAVPEIIQDYWVSEEAKLRKTDEARRVFLPGGKVPELGSSFNNPDIARSLRLIAEKGRDAFYKGETHLCRLRWDHGVAGPYGLFRRVGRAHFDRLSWLENLRTSSERPGHGRSGNAQHNGDFCAR